jgi:hypothetical protein
MDATNAGKVNVQRRRTNAWVVEDEPEDTRELVVDGSARAAAVLSPPDIQLSGLATSKLADVNAKEDRHSSFCISRKS